MGSRRNFFLNFITWLRENNAWENPSIEVELILKKPTHSNGINETYSVFTEETEELWVPVTRLPKSSFCRGLDKA